MVVCCCVKSERSTDDERVMHSASTGHGVKHTLDVLAFGRISHTGGGAVAHVPMFCVLSNLAFLMLFMCIVFYRPFAWLFFVRPCVDKGEIASQCKLSMLVRRLFVQLRGCSSCGRLPRQSNDAVQHN